MENQFIENGITPTPEECKELYILEKVDIIFQGTKFFCNQYICLYDQLVNLAESAKMNILNRTEASTRSKETKIRHIDLARASLRQLKIAYKDFLRSNNLKYWNTSHPYYQALTQKHSIANPTYDLYKKGIESPDLEVAVNVLYSLTNDTYYLLVNDLKRLEADFQKQGGVSKRWTKEMFYKGRRNR